MIGLLSGVGQGADAEIKAPQRSNSPFIVVHNTIVITSDRTERRRNVRGTQRVGEIKVLGVG